MHESIYDGVLFLDRKCSVIRNVGFGSLCSALPLRVWEVPCSCLGASNACNGHVSHLFTHSSLANSRTLSLPFTSIPIYYPLIILNSTLYKLSHGSSFKLLDNKNYHLTQLYLFCNSIHLPTSYKFQQNNKNTFLRNKCSCILWWFLLFNFY